MLSAVQIGPRIAAAAGKARSSAMTGPRRTIVVVDDNEDHRELMREDPRAARFRRADGGRRHRTA
jgi:hypothetical protein